ncbi:MAG: hypothetical protein HQ553_13090, partial [Chloroflexi bacterium]|nr:hypothetical protein [Chloroflexota bacterium]
MPTANDMRTLAHEIFDSYETRIEGVAQIKEATQTQLNDYDEAHKTMAHELHADLTRARTDLAGCSKTQLKEFAEAHKAMGHELHAELARARTDLGQTEAVRKQEEDQRAQERAQVVA